MLYFGASLSWILCSVDFVALQLRVEGQQFPRRRRQFPQDSGVASQFRGTSGNKQAALPLVLAHQTARSVMSIPEKLRHERADCLG
jgi:hypothetical protein